MGSFLSVVPAGSGTARSVNHSRGDVSDRPGHLPGGRWRRRNEVLRAYDRVPGRRDGENSPATPQAEDVDHSGKVDILDAFVVAKLVETGKQAQATYDVNGDGEVDQSDVDRIAHAAVAVAPDAAEQRRVQ